MRGRCDVCGAVADAAGEKRRIGRRPAFGRWPVFNVASAVAVGATAGGTLSAWFADEMPSRQAAAILLVCVLLLLVRIIGILGGSDDEPTDR